jgi:DNA-binding transcriptional ArsR family regulator
MRTNEPQTDVDLQVLKVVSSDVRLKILAMLKDPVAIFPEQVDGDLIKDGVCADSIRDMLAIAPATASRHLTMLVDAGLLTATRKRGWTFYRRNDRAIQGFVKSLKGL